jgi:hypothetical protein
MHTWELHCEIVYQNYYVLLNTQTLVLFLNTHEHITK